MNEYIYTLASPGPTIWDTGAHKGPSGPTIWVPERARDVYTQVPYSLFFGYLILALLVYMYMLQVVPRVSRVRRCIQVGYSTCCRVLQKVKHSCRYILCIHVSLFIYIHTLCIHMHMCACTYIYIYICMQKAKPMNHYCAVYLRRMLLQLNLADGTTSLQILEDPTVVCRWLLPYSSHATLIRVRGFAKPHERSTEATHLELHTCTRLGIRLPDLNLWGPRTQHWSLKSTAVRLGNLFFCMLASSKPYDIQV